MKNLLLLALLLPVWALAQIEYRFEQNETFTYDETIAAYEYLDSQYAAAKLLTAGSTDAGKPLHLFVIDQQKVFDPEKSRQNNKRVMLVNNGIHPGEPCGIDASVYWAEELLKNNSPLLENTVVLIVPVYNVGGILNRGCCFRANQNGPIEHGFRGNAKNLDLNRDFIKCDSQNARSFAALFQQWSPDVFVDTHTTNGADYNYTMTLIAPNKGKMNSLLGSVTERDLVPFLYRKMEDGGYEMAPYVSTKKGTPESGIMHYPDSPRYSSGYANLFHSLGFTAETHMLKPFEDRVKSTVLLLQSLLEMTDQYGALIGELRGKALTQTVQNRSVELNHRVDTTTHDLFLFKGYEVERRTSPVTGQEQHYYNTDKPYEKEVPYYNKLEAGHTTTLPAYYIIPQAWQEVVELLRLNGTEVKELKSETELEVEVLYIDDYATTTRPYEGHYLHYDVKTRSKKMNLTFAPGDFVVETNQPVNQYLAHVLDPRSEDSFFCWNFFDAILMQKEYFSTYLFDAEAERLLEENPELNGRFMAKKKDPEFAEDARAQLRFIYERSPWYEQTHNRYPVAGFDGSLPKGKLR